MAPWLGVAVGIAALAAYLATLLRGVPGGDSGELIASAVTGGVAHPPGYPLFLLLARAATLVPLGSVAARVNGLSAVCDAAAAGLLTFAVARLSTSAAAGVFAGGLFAFSTRVWAYATVAEVFALNNLLLATLLATLAVAGSRPSSRQVAIASALLGLGIANHLTSIFVSVPIVAWLILAAWRAGAPPLRLARVAALGGLLGILPYARRRDHAPGPESTGLRLQEPRVRAGPAISAAAGREGSSRGGDAGVSAPGAAGRSRCGGDAG
jgi:hypothetical protein